MKPFITTHSGRRVDPTAMTLDDIVITDIAHALALCNRFAGHSRWPISVAQHSVGVSLLPGVPPLQGLLHDAAEAYVGDMTKWLKSVPEMEFYRRVEDDLQRQIYARFGCPVALDPGVEHGDKTMVRYEYHNAFDTAGLGVPGYPPVSLEEEEVLGRVFAETGWRAKMDWSEAEDLFLARFNQLVDTLDATQNGGGVIYTPKNTLL